MTLAMPPSSPRQPQGWGALVTVLCWPNNVVTVGRVVLVGGVVLPMLSGRQWPAVAASIAFMLGYWLFDYLDGWLARRLGRCSSFGESLDLFADRTCDLLLSALLLTTRPEHMVTVLIFLIARLAPDVVVARYAGLSPGMFATLAQEALTGRLRAGKRAVSLAIEANSLAKALFFCGALFWSFPAWTGALIVLPALIFLGLTANVMRLHAARVLAERDMITQ